MSGRGTGASRVVALGIDIGSSNVKASVVSISASDGVVELAVRASPTPREADELVSAVLRLVADAVSAADEAPRAVGIASMAESGAPLDEHGSALLPLQRWDGAGDHSDLDAIVRRAGASELFAATGVPALPKAPLAMWARLARLQPQVRERMRRWAGAADLIALALTGRLATDHTLAARTMAFRASEGGAAGRWDDDLLALASLDASRLPELLVPGEPVGPVTAGAAESTGLRVGVPVHIAGHDHVVGAWAAGMRGAGAAADSLGTAEAVLRVLDGSAGADLTEAVRLSGMSLARTVDDEPLLLAGSSSAGALVRWWAENHGGADGSATNSGARPIPPSEPAVEPTGLTVLPYLSGRQTPAPDPGATVRVSDARGDVDPSGLDPSVMQRAVLEGLSLQARWMLEEQSALVGDLAGPVLLVGGRGAADRGWMRTKAQVTTHPTRLVTSAEPVASGAALLAAHRAGLLDMPTPTLPTIELDRVPGDPYLSAFHRFVSAATGSGGVPRTSRGEP